MLKTIAGLQGVTILSKDAQKKISGGTWVCSCTGMPGTWEYTRTPSVTEIYNDINTYCQHGGTCNNSIQ
jgi:hypothetical protein